MASRTAIPTRTESMLPKCSRWSKRRPARGVALTTRIVTADQRKHGKELGLIGPKRGRKDAGYRRE